jgi:hypothetical protein
MALSKIQPASMDLTANYAFTGTNSVAGIDYPEKKLSTLTASSSSTLSFTTNIDSTYNIYKFRFVNIHPATNNADLGFKASINGGTGYGVTTTTTFFEARHSENDSNAAEVEYNTAFDLAQSTGLVRCTGSIDTDNDASASGELILFNPSSTTFVKHFIINANRMFDYNSGTPPQWSVATYSAGYVNTTSAVNAIQFSMDSGNIDSGTIEMYGIN